MQLCLRGEGEAGPMGGPAGDLYVDIQVKPHRFSSGMKKTCPAASPSHSHRRRWARKLKSPYSTAGVN
jgi:hypothetical protein